MKTPQIFSAPDSDSQLVERTERRCEFKLRSPNEGPEALEEARCIPKSDGPLGQGAASSDWRMYGSCSFTEALSNQQSLLPRLEIGEFKDGVDTCWAMLLKTLYNTCFHAI